MPFSGTEVVRACALLRGAAPHSPENKVGMVAHHFTVDVEEYFQVSAFESRVPRGSWDAYESRVARCVDRLLELLAARDARGTFFVLGWIAARQADVVRAIHSAGHEIAAHGWDHRRVTELDPPEFRDSVRRTKKVLEDLTGAPVLGFRAPSFSIVPGREWALDVLIEEGYRYDSSLFPVLRPGYGYPGGRRAPHWLDRPAGRIAEFPPATLRFGRVTVPTAGGAYLRLFPYELLRASLRDFEAEGDRGTVYVHPWEVDPEQPRIRVPWPTRIRHYGGLRTTVSKLRRLLDDFHFTPMGRTLEAL